MVMQHGRMVFCTKNIYSRGTHSEIKEERVNMYKSQKCNQLKNQIKANQSILQCLFFFVHFSFAFCFLCFLHFAKIIK